MLLIVNLVTDFILALVAIYFSLLGTRLLTGVSWKKIGIFALVLAIINYGLSYFIATFFPGDFLGLVIIFAVDTLIAYIIALNYLKFKPGDSKKFTFYFLIISFLVYFSLGLVIGALVLSLLGQTLGMG